MRADLLMAIINRRNYYYKQQLGFYVFKKSSGTSLQLDHTVYTSEIIYPKIYHLGNMDVATKMSTTGLWIFLSFKINYVVVLFLLFYDINDLGWIKRMSTNASISS